MNRISRNEAATARHRSKQRPIVRIHLFGAMRATTYLGENILPRGKRARAVLGYLCLARDHQVSPADLAGMLWDQAPRAAARANLGRALRDLSAAFGRFAEELFVSERDLVRLNADACWIDAAALLALDPSGFDGTKGGSKALCRGVLLEGLDGTSASFDRWLAAERERLADRLEALLTREREQAEESRARGREQALAGMSVHRGMQEGGAPDGAPRHTLLVTQPSFPIKPVGGGPNPSFGERANDNLVGQPRPDIATPASVRSRLRVGVLPFLALGSGRKENLAFSIAQGTAAALARFRWFDVIAPISLRPLPSAHLTDEHQLRRAGLDYAVDGTISGNGKGLQINVRLMHLAEYARPVWSESFVLERGELHRLDELVTARIVAQIDPIILFIEGQPRRREHYGATGLLLLAIPLIFSMERRKYEKAGRLIREALALEPDNSMVAAWSAHWHCFYVGQGWAKDVKETYAITEEHALRAIRLDPDNAEALGIYGHICSIMNKDFDSAIYYFDRSLRLNPSLAFSWAFSALTYCYIGEPERALERLKRYRDLSPSDPYFSFFENFFGIAYFFAGDYERSVLVSRRVVKSNPSYVAGYKPLIASLGHLGRRDEAKGYVKRLLALEPGFTVTHFGAVYPFRKPEDRRRYMEGLRLAGIPEQ